MVDDEELVRQIQGDDLNQSQAALSRFFRLYQEDVWRMVRSRVETAQDADDVASETWFVVLKKIEHYEWTGKPIKYWLLSIAHHVALAHQRHLGPFMDSYDDVQSGPSEAATYLTTRLHINERQMPEPARQVQRKADRLLQEAINDLTDVQRNIILLSYYGEMDSAKEIGSRLNIRSGTVRVYRKRALSKIKQYLISKGEYCD